MIKSRLLLIDDSEEIHVLIKKTLNELCDVTSSYDSKSAREMFESKSFDIVIIDLMLGTQNGMELLKEFKEIKTELPTRFFIMTAKDSVVDEALGHGFGVDEYLKKPVDREVLKAIVKKNLKIVKDQATAVIDLHPFYVLPENFQAFIDINGKKEEIQLTVKEFKLFVKLISHPDKTFTREELFAQVWENDSNSTFRTIDMHVSSLRKKLKDHGHYIKTIHQVGYKFTK